MPGISGGQSIERAYARRMQIGSRVCDAEGLACLVMWCGWGLLGLAMASPLEAQQAPWTRPLEAGRSAYAHGDLPEAARRFAEADAALGGWPYETDPAFGEDGRWVHAAERDPIRMTFQCPWALAVLSQPAPAASDRSATIARAEALQRVRLWCAPAERARAAQLLGDERQAALVLHDQPVPSGDAARRGAPSAEATAWAAAVASGRFPVARDADEALSFVRSHVRAGRAIDAECGPLTARRVRVPMRDAPGLSWMDALYDDEDEDENDEEAARPFARGGPDAVAWVRCQYEPPQTPYEEPMMGPGAQTVSYFLVRTAAGVQVAGWFRDQPLRECWTGVIQGEIGYQVLRAGGTRLYAITRVEGYEDYSGGDSDLLRELVVCDPVRLACRTLPLAEQRTTHTYPADPDSREAPTAQTQRWRATPSFSGGRVRLSTRDPLPPSLMALGGRGMTLDAFFTEHLEWYDAPLLPAVPRVAPPSVDGACPWRVADADGSTNVRAEPSGRAAIASSLANDTALTVAERHGRWWRITAPVAGWVWAPNLAQRCP